MRPFAGDEGVDTGPGGVADFPAGPAGDDADVAAHLGTAGKEDGIGPGRLGQPSDEFHPGKSGGSAEADVLSLGRKERRQ